MSNISDLRPWFREDLARVLMSVYFASAISDSRTTPNDRYRNGFAAALSSVAINVGVNPETFLTPEDIVLLRQNSIEK